MLKNKKYKTQLKVPKKKKKINVVENKMVKRIFIKVQGY